jgi:hypothetical protein
MDCRCPIHDTPFLVVLKCNNNKKGASNDAPFKVFIGVELL